MFLSSQKDSHALSSIESLCASGKLCEYGSPCFRREKAESVRLNAGVLAHQWCKSAQLLALFGSKPKT